MALRVRALLQAVEDDWLQLAAFALFMRLSRSLTSKHRRQDWLEIFSRAVRLDAVRIEQIAPRLPEFS